MSEDVLHREVIENKLHSIRLFTKTNKLPKWGERFIHNNDVKIVEESILDPSKKTLITYTRNVGYTSVMVGICFFIVLYKISTKINNVLCFIKSSIYLLTIIIFFLGCD